jgi:prepilin-type processing-associated H-X9-DG protein
MTLGIQMYAQDYDEMMPARRYDSSIYYVAILTVGGYTTPGGYVYTDEEYMPWPICINPYVKNINIFNCPSISNAWNGGVAGHECNNISYGFNAYAANQALATFNFPAETMVIADKEGTDRYTIYTIGHIARNRHNEGANIGYADGHAKWEKGSNIPDRDIEGSALVGPRFWRAAGGRND